MIFSVKFKVGSPIHSKEGVKLVKGFNKIIGSLERTSQIDMNKIVSIILVSTIHYLVKCARKLIQLTSIICLFEEISANYYLISNIETIQ